MSAHLRRPLHGERMQHVRRDELADLVVPVAHQRWRAHDERRRRLLPRLPLLCYGCCTSKRQGITKSTSLFRKVFDNRKQEALV